MNILLSAYACQPNRGSEPGVGWHTALELARRGHQLVVITRRHYRHVVESAAPDPALANVRFVYYDLPAWTTRWHVENKIEHLYYFFWQIGVTSAARRVLREGPVDLIHHITFGVYRTPSFLGLLGRPFFFGPVGGGETAPWSLQKEVPFKRVLLELVRDGVNAVFSANPLLWITYRTSRLIFCKTEETRRLIPRRYRHKARIQMEVGLRRVSSEDDLRPRSFGDAPRFLFVGKLLYWKGAHLAIKAFARILPHFPGGQLDIVGEGGDEGWLRGLADAHGVSDRVNWTPRVPQDELFRMYQAFDVVLFPSLHDSSGNVVLEAFSFGLPVACLRLGGPGVLVDDTCGVVAEVVGRPEADVVADLSDQVVALLRDEKEFYARRRGALRRAKQYTWAQTVAQIYGQIEAELPARPARPAQLVH